jgi:hypothetical protein
MLDATPRSLHQHGMISRSSPSSVCMCLCKRHFVHLLGCMRLCANCPCHTARCMLLMARPACVHPLCRQSQTDGQDKEPRGAARLRRRCEHLPFGQALASFNAPAAYRVCSAANVAVTKAVLCACYRCGMRDGCLQGNAVCGYIGGTLLLSNFYMACSHSAGVLHGDDNAGQATEDGGTVLAGAAFYAGVNPASPPLVIGNGAGPSYIAGDGAGPPGSPGDDAGPSNIDPASPSYIAGALPSSGYNAGNGAGPSSIAKAGAGPASAAGAAASSSSEEG